MVTGFKVGNRAGPDDRVAVYAASTTADVEGEPPC